MRIEEVKKKFPSLWMSFSAPFLILLAVIGLLQREGGDQLQIIPALVVGVGLIISGAWGRSLSRKKLLLAIRQSQKDGNEP